MSSTITLNFNSPAELNDKLTINDTNSGSDINIIFENDGSLGFFIQVSGSIDQDINETYNYLQGIYNGSNSFTITRDFSNKTILIVDNSNTKFFNVTTNNTSGRITTNISNTNPTPDIEITNLVIKGNANPCGLFDIEITTNQQATQLTSPVNQAVTTNPFTVSGLSRQELNSYTFTVTDGNTIDSYSSVYTPRLLSSFFTINKVLNLNDTYSVDVSFARDRFYATDFEISYSLDNVTFYTSTSFSNLSTGSYTLYIKDNIGCSLNIPFEIEEQELNIYTRESVFEISNQNSLISIKRNDPYKNILNTMSYEEEGLNRCDFKQLFQSDDGILTEQFKTSYNDVTIKIHDCQGNSSIVVPEQKTDNYDITDVRDITITSVNYLNKAYIGVKYVAGNTYNPDTLAKTGEYYLASLVPDWMTTDDRIIIQGSGTYRVQDVVFQDNVQVLVLDVLVNGFNISQDSVVLGTSKYNQLNYNVFEFSLDLSTLSGDYYVTYTANDSEFELKEYKTEWFNVSTEQKDTYLLNYYHSKNNETNYSTGIQYSIRIPYEKPLVYIPNDTQETYETDTNVVSLKTTYRDSYELSTDNIPVNFLRKIGFAISNDRLLLNGLSLLKSEEIESEALTGSNLYKALLRFSRSDYVFESNKQDNSIVLPDNQALNINNNGSDLGVLLIN